MHLCCRAVRQDQGDLEGQALADTFGWVCSVALGACHQLPLHPKPSERWPLYINAVNVSTFTQSFAFASPQNFHHALMSSSRSDKLLC